MIWDKYRVTMERNAIKTDDMAAEDPYFMATHMPFAQLEVFSGGDSFSKPVYMTENQIFDELICNPDNMHRMIIVRGNNGTGKSHLIRYMKARMERSPSTVYDPRKEQIIFLRRLNNSVRGAFSQLLEQNVIQDSDIAEKMRKFVSSSDSKDETSFKTEILYSYVTAVANDRSGKYYTARDCACLAQYLSDRRIQELLQREEGAITKCYQTITASSGHVLKDVSIFTAEDFASKRAKAANRKIMKDGSADAQDFVQTIFNDEEEVIRLVNYLNRFTGSVVQHCADISSETAKSIFEQLRRDLKKQGKNLTLFIEDFTGFTGVDSELITVLSTEHGGSYDYLCRVTSVIGITDGYYDQFKDNFKDRVTHQISVTERSYGTDEFLIQMSARYLNAIYCNPDDIQFWYSQGADPKQLPVGGFVPPFNWESVLLDGKELTLYPFNRKALTRLYNQMPVKSPRMFLRIVIKDQLKEYFDGKKYGDDWRFPLNPGLIPMKNGPHSSIIDRNNALADNDRQRVKNLLAIWGDGSASGQYIDGCLCIGGLNRKFLTDIGLDTFEPIGTVAADDAAQAEPAAPPSAEISISPLHVQSRIEVSPVKKETPAERRHRLHQEDIHRWFTAGEILQYDNDYRTWLREFLIGSSNQCGAVNWQDIDVPAYIANERLSDLQAYYIEGQGSAGREQRALVYLERTAEIRDVLTALLERNYADSWDFENSIYYQQKLAVWLEKNRMDIIKKVCVSYPQKLPILEWCLALQYFKAILLGCAINTQSPAQTAACLFRPYKKADTMACSTQEWSNVITFLSNRESDFDTAYDLLTRSANTTMGAVAISKAPKTFVYHGDEIISAVERLKTQRWDISELLPAQVEDNFLFHPAKLLKRLYPRLKKLAAAEQENLKNIKEKLEDYIGELNQDNLLELFGSIQDMFSVFSQNGIIVQSRLRDKYTGAPVELAGAVLQAVSALENAGTDDFAAQLFIYSRKNCKTFGDTAKYVTAPVFLSDFLKDLQEIERIAQREEHQSQTARISLVSNMDLDGIAETAFEGLRGIRDILINMEVRDASM